MVDIYTAQYRYSGPDRLDITAATKHVFAPTWDMVKKYKKGQIVASTYEKMYRTLMAGRRADIDTAIEWMLTQNKVTLVCYCPAGEFCHRLIVANELNDKIPGITYKGERKI